MKSCSSIGRFAALFVGFMAMIASTLADSEAPFARANQEFSGGRFKEAIVSYEAIVRSGDWTAALFYNLGNAYFRTRDFGRAILNYERALALEPNHPEVQANLRIARDEARALELLPAWPEQFLRFATLNQYTIGVAVLFWTSAILIAAFVLSRRRRRSVMALSICSLVSAALLFYVIMAVEDGRKGRSVAIVTGVDVQARLATAETAASVLALPAGSEIKVERQRGDWVYATLPNNLRGWIPATGVEFVRL